MAQNCKQFALVVPTLNEGENIRAMLDRATAALASVSVPWEIIVVDDQSSDSTAQVVQEYANGQASVRLVRRSGKRGLAGAITYGWDQTEADLIGVMDADLQHPPELLPQLIREACEDHDIVIASRYVRPHSMDGWNPVRKTLSRLSVFASLPVQRRDLKVSDPLSGFFVLRRECIAGIQFQESGFKLLLEILARARINSVSELPFEFACRRFGRSKANTMTAVHYFGLLWKLAHGRRTERRQ